MIEVKEVSKKMVSEGLERDTKKEDHIDEVVKAVPD